MSGERGQATLELVLLAPFLVASGLGAAQLLLYVRAQERAEMLLDQAASVVAEGRALPAALARAGVVVDGRRVRVSVAVPSLPPLYARLTVRGEARLP